MKDNKTIYLIFICLLLLFSSLAEAVQIIEDFSVEEYLSGKKRVQIMAEKASIGPKRVGFLKTRLIKEAVLTKPQIIFFKDDKKSVDIKADSGKMDMSTRKINLEKKVILITSDGKKLTSKEMALDPKSGRLSIKGSYMLDDNGKIKRGVGLESDIELGEIALLR